MEESEAVAHANLQRLDVVPGSGARTATRSAGRCEGGEHTVVYRRSHDVKGRSLGQGVVIAETEFGGLGACDILDLATAIDRLDGACADRYLHTSEELFPVVIDGQEIRMLHALSDAHELECPEVVHAGNRSAQRPAGGLVECARGERAG